MKSHKRKITTKRGSHITSNVTFSKGFIVSGGNGASLLPEKCEMGSEYEPTCNHCGTLVKYRNLSGYCDHLYYPENCKTCEKNERVDSKPIKQDCMYGCNGCPTPLTREDYENSKDLPANQVKQGWKYSKGEMFKTDGNVTTYRSPTKAEFMELLEKAREEHPDWEQTANFHYVLGLEQARTQTLKSIKKQVKQVFRDNGWTGSHQLVKDVLSVLDSLESQ